MKPLDLLKGKTIRYWLIEGSEVCLEGKLIAWDNIGVLVGTTDEGFKGIDGSEFYPWKHIKFIGYFKEDDK